MPSVHTAKTITYRPTRAYRDRLARLAEQLELSERAIVRKAVEQLLDELAPDELAELAGFNRSAAVVAELGDQDQAAAAARYAARRAIR